MASPELTPQPSKKLFEVFDHEVDAFAKELDKKENELNELQRDKARIMKLLRAKLLQRNRAAKELGQKEITEREALCRVHSEPIAA